MQRLLKRPGYRLYPPDSLEARALPPSTALSPASNEPRAPRSGPSSGSTRTGCSGVSRAGWRPDLPDACREPFIPLLWVKVHELLGRVPAGSTARFVQDGTLPGDTRHGADVYRLAS
jgi:hypothetical protein